MIDQYIEGLKVLRFCLLKKNFFGLNLNILLSYFDEFIKINLIFLRLFIHNLKVTAHIFSKLFYINNLLTNYENK